MKKEDLKKFKEGLVQQKRENNKKISLYNERTRMLKTNSFEDKAINILALSEIAYFIVILISSILVKNIEYISLPIYHTLIIGSSLGIGTLANTLAKKIYKTKERFKSFSNAKNDAEKLKEKIKYEIELEKAMYKNKIIDQTMNVIVSSQTILDKMSTQYDIKNKIALQSKSELEIKVNELSDFLKEQYNELDILITQKVLHDNFWKIRSKMQKRKDLILASIIAGIIPIISIITYLPVMEKIAYSTSFTNFATFFIPAIASSIGVSGYMIKRNKDKRTVFNNFNLQLGENSLVDMYKKIEDIQNEKEKIMDSIEKQIRNISLAEVHLQENKIYLEFCTNEEDRTKVESNKRTLVEEKNKDMQLIEHSIPSIPSGPKLVRRKKIKDICDN